MRHKKALLAAIAALALLLVAASSTVFGGSVGNGQGPGPGGPRAVGALGVAQIGGQDVIVHVWAVVPPGANASEVAREALRGQGARPFESAALGSEGFTLTGLVWGSLPVIQNYNPANDPTGGGGGTALTNGHGTWDGVATSYFDIDYGGTTTRCPSLVRECSGPQYWDGYNDVAWLALRPGILGVTWYGDGSYGPEADMALSTRYTWNVGCINVQGSYDAETVFLHENGHVVGLGHSDDSGSVMQAYYHGADCDLGTDDEEGVTFLYDSAITGSVSGTVTSASDGTPIGGATVVLEGTSLSATTAGDGTYAISDVPDPVTYTVTASADGFDSATISRLKVDGADGGEVADFVLTASSGEEEGGPPPCKGWKKNDPGC